MLICLLLLIYLAFRVLFDDCQLIAGIEGHRVWIWLIDVFVALARQDHEHQVRQKIIIYVAVSFEFLIGTYSHRGMAHIG